MAIVILVPIFLLVIYFFSFIFSPFDYALSGFKYGKKEEAINRKFWQEVHQIPQLRVTNFMLWEGDSLVTAQIEGKGEVRFWYGINGVPRLNYVGGYNTESVCFYVNSSGEKTAYAFHTSLYLGSPNEFAKWFPFEINNLKDMVDKYDFLLDSIFSLPVNPEMVNFKDKYSKRKVVKESNPDFILKKNFRSKEVWCDLYR